MPKVAFAPLFVVRPGFGELIRVAASQLQTPRVFSLILCLSLLGLAPCALIKKPRRRLRPENRW